MTYYTDRQKQIIQASLDIIAKTGNRSLTIKKIAKKIGISEPAIYRHFESKADILLGIIGTIKDGRGAELSKIKNSKIKTIDKINLALSTRARRFAKNPSLAAVIFTEEIFKDKSQLSEAFVEIMDESHNRMVKIIREGQEKGEIIDIVDAEELTLLIIGAFRLLITRWHMGSYNFDLGKSTKKLVSAIEKLI